MITGKSYERTPSKSAQPPFKFIFTGYTVQLLHQMALDLLTANLT
jgi:hypothetical protein